MEYVLVWVKDLIGLEITLVYGRNFLLCLWDFDAGDVSLKGFFVCD